MTNQSMLAEYARLFEAAKERWPDAPGLPEGYAFASENGEMCYGPRRYLIPDDAALALCAVTAMEIGAWWEECESVLRQARMEGLYGGGYKVRVWYEDEAGVKITLLDKVIHKPCAAALAMLRAIVEVA